MQTFLTKKSFFNKSSRKKQTFWTKNSFSMHTFWIKKSFFNKRSRNIQTFGTKKKKYIYIFFFSIKRQDSNFMDQKTLFLLKR